MDRYAICQPVLRSGDVATDIAWASEAGAAAIALNADSVQSLGTDAVRDLLAGHDLRCSSVMGGFDPLLEMDVESAADHAAAVISEYTDLEPVGVLLTTGPLKGRSPQEADRACADWLARAAPVAAEADVLLMLEPVHPLLRHISYVHTLRHGAELTGSRPGTALVADTGHLWWDRGLADDIKALAPQTGSVQIVDVDAEALTRYEYRRIQLGDGVIPLADIITALEKAGYRGFYENEVIARVPRDERVDHVRLGGQRLARWLEHADVEH